MGWRTDPWQYFPIPTEDYIQLFHFYMLGRGRGMGAGGGGWGGQFENNLDQGAGGAGHMGVQTEGFTLFSRFPKDKS